MTRVGAAWVGAIIEAEGTILTRYNGEIMMASSDVETVATVLRLVGDGRVYSQKQVGMGTRPMWQWYLSAKNAIRALIPQIAPFLTSKRHAAELVLIKGGNQ